MFGMNGECKENLVLLGVIRRKGGGKFGPTHEMKYLNQTHFYESPMQVVQQDIQCQVCF